MKIGSGAKGSFTQTDSGTLDERRAVMRSEIHLKTLVLVLSPRVTPSGSISQHPAGFSTRHFETPPTHIVISAERVDQP